MTKELQHIVHQFIPTLKIGSVDPFGSGHINDSYKVTGTEPGTACYVLQRINHLIFNDVVGLSENIRSVTEHIRRKLEANPEPYRGFSIFRQWPAISGQNYFQDDKGNFWRLIDFIPGSISYDRVENPQIAYEAGKAYALFQELTADLDGSMLTEILPAFHDVRSRLGIFRRTVRLDPAGRVKDHAMEIDFIEQRAAGMHRIHDLGMAGQLPVRVTHNDTKINNVLFTSDQKAISVVDLDTVMPGYVLYDFGDAIRTGAATCGEDEADASKATVSPDLFRAYAHGYLDVARRFLTPAETGNLVFSARYMTWLIGLRFFTDHLDGDRYYKVLFPGHNLRRARVQFRLLENMEAQADEMERIISETLR